jgi:peptidoglycan/LPS O-acetylase OafA/YrhL
MTGTGNDARGISGMAMYYSSMADRRFFDSLESMRGIAAFTVVLLHMPPLIPARYVPGFIQNGFMMVPFFFVLSGFVIHYNYFDSLRNWPGLRDFLFLRLGRLYPVHFVFLLAWLGIEIGRYIAAHHYGLNAPATRPFRENSGIAFFENLFLVQALGFTNDSGTFNGPSWSISVECYTYVIFAIVTIFARRFFLVVAGTMIVIGVTVLGMQAAGSFADWLNCIVGFFLGSLISVAAKRKWTCPIAALPILMLFFAVLMIRPLSYAASLLIYPIAGAVIFSLLTDRGYAAAVLAFAPIRWLGRVSYSLYMSHMIMIWCCGIALAWFLRADLSDSAASRFSHLSASDAGAAYIGILALVLLLTATVYYWVEEPCRHWSRSRILRPERPGIGANAHTL